MKEIVLSVKRQKTEIKIFCVCIALAYLMNIISIITYGILYSSGKVITRPSSIACKPNKPKTEE